MKKSNPAKRKVTFKLVAPDAKVVSLLGSFTNWQEAPVPLTKGKGGLWSKTLTLEPGRHEYRLLVDGQWINDPLSDGRAPNPFGGENCLRMVA